MMLLSQVSRSTIGRRSPLGGFPGLNGAPVSGHAEQVRPDGERDQARSPAALPAVAGRTLLGAKVVLPADFPADRTLAVVAFQRGQQSRVDRWIERAVAAGVPPTTRGARVYPGRRRRGPRSVESVAAGAPLHRRRDDSRDR